MEADALAGSASSANSVLEKPKPEDVSDFSKALSNGSQQSDRSNGSAPIATQAQDVGKSGGQITEAQLKQLLTMLLELIAMLEDPEGKANGQSGGKPEGGSPTGGAPAGGGGSGSGKVENNKVVGDNVSAGNGEIPKPTEHMQGFNLGDKQVTIGGDGSANATEVQQTKQTMTDLYANSPSFRSMIDSSPNESFEISVGRRSDNMSWGNADGRVFMNINNITPGSSDNFQALTAHELAHAGVDQKHGADMERFEQAVSQEA